MRMRESRARSRKWCSRGDELGGDGDVLSVEARMALHCRNKEGGVGIVLGRRVGKEYTATGSRG